MRVTAPERARSLARGCDMIKSIAIFLSAAMLTLVPLSISTCAAGFQADAQRRCCKVCSRGKACGDSCIARHLNCHRGRGCACDSR